jgi:hypothetical protein
LFSLRWIFLGPSEVLPDLLFSLSSGKGLIVDGLVDLSPALADQGIAFALLDAY